MLMGSPAVEPEGAALHEGSALAFLTEAKVLDLAQGVEREAVVDLGDVDVRGSHAGHGKRARRSLGGAERGEVGSLGDRAGESGWPSATPET